MLPDGKPFADKFTFGIHVGDEMVGCADVIRGYPNASTAFLGLLFIAESFQRKGIGGAAFGQLERCVRSWRTCSVIRLAVIRTNEEVAPFWQVLGFQPTGETAPFCRGPVESKSIFFEKLLD